MELVESKSLLAKLMATENLIIEQRNVRTAAFDVKNRILVVPILDKNLSSEIYDLFMGHEVGHALYTPEAGLIRARDSGINLMVANIVEDSRIERKIKYKYPGLKRSFVKAYKELLNKDFFGTKDVNINKMNLLDRINLHCKGGASLNILFSEEEKNIVEMVENTETYDDVIDVSKKIMDFIKQKNEERKKQFKEESDEYDFDGDGESDIEFDDDFDEQQNDSSSKEDVRKNSKDDLMDDTSSESETDKTKNVFDDTKMDEREFRSFTEESFSQNQTKLFDEKSRGYNYINVPDFDMKSIFDYKKVWKQYKESNYEIDKTLYKKVRNEGNKVVSYLVKEFEMKKNADQLKRATTAKTGELDVNKLFSYQFSEDIFKKLSIIPGGKSHGLVIFLDWSGSMHEHLGNTIKQLINLTFFCKKVNIPFEVYCIKEAVGNSIKFSLKEGDLACGGLELMNIISSRMNAAEFNYACSALINMSVNNGYRIYNRFIPDWMQLHGTPLNESIVCAMKIVPEFQKKNKLQIVNTVFLTDGEGHTIYNKIGEIRSVTGFSEFIVLRDPVTKNQEQIHIKEYAAKQTDALIHLLRKRTNSNVMGFYIISGRDFNRKLSVWFKNTNDHEEIKTEFKKNKFKVLENTGYNEYYILHSNSMDTEEDLEMKTPDNLTTRNLVSAFTKYAGARVANRVVLNRFIHLIS